MIFGRLVAGEASFVQRLVAGPFSRLDHRLDIYGASGNERLEANARTPLAETSLFSSDETSIQCSAAMIVPSGNGSFLPERHAIPFQLGAELFQAASYRSGDGDQPPVAISACGWPTFVSTTSTATRLGGYVSLSLALMLWRSPGGEVLSGGRHRPSLT
jgi:hypothetical protein